MEVQWVAKDSKAYIYDGMDLIATLANCLSKKDVDAKLNRLGSCRSQRWYKRNWGYSSKIRRK